MPDNRRDMVLCEARIVIAEEAKALADKADEKMGTPPTGAGRDDARTKMDARHAEASAVAVVDMDEMARTFSTGGPKKREKAIAAPLAAKGTIGKGRAAKAARHGRVAARNVEGDEEEGSLEEFEGVVTDDVDGEEEELEEMMVDAHNVKKVDLEVPIDDEKTDGLEDLNDDALFIVVE